MRKKIIIRKRFWYVLLALTAFFIIYCYLGKIVEEKTIYVEEKEAQSQTLSDENTELERKQNFAKDEEFVEQQAHADGYAKEGETMYDATGKN